MEDNVKKVTGKKRVSRSEASEVPEEVAEKVTAKETKVKEAKAKHEDTKGKVSTIEVLPSGVEKKRSLYTEDISDFWNHQPAVKKGTHGNPDLHLVDYRGRISWFSARQVQITIRRVDEVIVDNRPPTKYDYIAFPKYTGLIVEAGGKCKGCG